MISSSPFILGVSLSNFYYHIERKSFYRQKRYIILRNGKDRILNISHKCENNCIFSSDIKNGNMRIHIFKFFRFQHKTSLVFELIGFPLLFDLSIENLLVTKAMHG